MSVFISIVSHGHSSLIRDLSCYDKLSDHFNVIIKNNNPNDDFSWLEKKENLFLIDEDYFCGFGRNNNIVFAYCQKKLKMSRNDYFIILNPDVIIEPSKMFHLLDLMKEDRVELASVNLFKDPDYTIFDNSIRLFPNFRQFLFSFLGLGNSSIIDKSKIFSSANVDWAAGSFLAFKMSHYQSLSGFDERYFMYCEDVDICYRSARHGRKLVFYPQINAVHIAKHENRHVFSRHFFWHVSSAFRFLLIKNNFKHKAMKSIIK